MSTLLGAAFPPSHPRRVLKLQQVPGAMITQAVFLLIGRGGPMVVLGLGDLNTQINMPVAVSFTELRPLAFGCCNDAISRVVVAALRSALGGQAW